MFTNAPVAPDKTEPYLGIKFEYSVSTSDLTTPQKIKRGNVRKMLETERLSVSNYFIGKEMSPR